jgi:hypothetical protein
MGHCWPALLHPALYGVLLGMAASFVCLICTSTQLIIATTHRLDHKKQAPLPNRATTLAENMLPLFALQDDCPIYTPGVTKDDVLKAAALAAKWKEPPRDALDTLVSVLA